MGLAFADEVGDGGIADEDLESGALGILGEQLPPEVERPVENAQFPTVRLGN